MAKLYELSQAYQTIQHLIEEGDQNDWPQALATLEDSIVDKAEGIARLIRGLESDADAYDAEAKRLIEKRSVATNAVGRLKDYLKQNMESCGLDKLKGTLFTVSLQASPPSCTITEIGIIPADYIRIIPAQAVPDKREIIEALKRGEEVPGARLEQTRHLRIR